MKNKKLKLDDLKVKSFVTSMGKTQKQTIDGGVWWTHTLDLTFPSKTGQSADQCASITWCCPEEHPWCTEGGDEGCVIRIC